MTPLLFKYPEDWSGTLASNRISGESHTVPRLKNKCFALDGGPFFTASMKLTQASTGKVLVRDVDYKPIFLYQDASIYAGQEICAAIAIINDAVDGAILVDYQILGGEYVSLVDALYKAIEQLQLDDRPINWDDIKNKPELYPPEPHIHHVSAIYGTEHLCMAIYALKQAILIGNAAENERLWEALAQLRKDMEAGDAEITDLMYAHINRLDNPHQVTKTQVGLSNIFNYPVATRVEAEAAVAPDRYMTAQTVGWAINKIAGDKLNAHLLDYSNPHRTTKAQVNLGNVENYGIATEDEAIQGIATNKYLTPYLVKLAIDKIAGDSLKLHLQDFNNPHKVTKAQTGLGLVDNYATATEQIAVAGIATNYFMTPFLVKKAIDKIAGDALNAHITNYNNPHNTTKAQIGLGSVVDYGVVTNEAQARSWASNLYATPWAARYAADSQINDRLYWGAGGTLVQVSGGNTRVGNNLYFGGSNANMGWDGSQIYVNVNMNVPNIYVRSDLRAKHDVRYLGEEMVANRLAALGAYVARYKLNEDQGGVGNTEIGLIAQAVSEKFPQLVTQDRDGMLRVSPTGLIALLVKGFSEHDERLAVLENRPALAV